jgi:hypothetical protein
MRRSLLRKRVMIPVASLFVIVAFLALVQATGLLFPLKGKCPDWMYPTIPDGGQVLAESVTYRYRDPTVVRSSASMSARAREATSSLTRTCTIGRFRCVWSAYRETLSSGAKAASS